MAKFVDRNNALKRSNDAHARLHRIMLDRKDLVSSDYHFEVLRNQVRKKKILSHKERKQIFNKYLNYHDVI